MSKSGFFYIAYRESDPDKLKFGRTNNINKRMCDHNGSTPDITNLVKPLYSIKVSDKATVEQIMLRKYENKKVQIPAEEYLCRQPREVHIITEIEREELLGFLNRFKECNPFDHDEFVCLLEETKCLLSSLIKINEKLIIFNHHKVETYTRQIKSHVNNVRTESGRNYVKSELIKPSFREDIYERNKDDIDMIRFLCKECEHVEKYKQALIEERKQFCRMVHHTLLSEKSEHMKKIEEVFGNGIVYKDKSDIVGIDSDSLYLMIVAPIKRKRGEYASLRRKRNSLLERLNDILCKQMIYYYKKGNTREPKLMENQKKIIKMISYDCGI